MTRLFALALRLPLALAAAACGSAHGHSLGGADAGPADPGACGIALEQSGTLDLDIPTVRITGRVTLDGAPLPGSGAAPVLAVALAGAVAEGGAFIDLARVRAAGGSYDVRVIPGEYRIVYSYGDCTAPEYPCQQGVAVRSAQLLRDGSLDLDLVTIRVSGRVTLDGQPLPPADVGRGSFSLVGADGSYGRLVLLDEHEGSYDVRLFPGVYNIDYLPGPACSGARYPCQQRVLRGCTAPGL